MSSLVCLLITLLGSIGYFNPVFTQLALVKINGSQRKTKVVNLVRCSSTSLSSQHLRDRQAEVSPVYRSSSKPPKAL